MKFDMLILEFSIFIPCLIIYRTTVLVTFDVLCALDLWSLFVDGELLISSAQSAMSLNLICLLWRYHWILL